jgi:cobalt/nickel transport system ATP-binding protein
MNEPAKAAVRVPATTPAGSLGTTGSTDPVPCPPGESPLFKGSVPTADDTTEATGQTAGATPILELEHVTFAYPDGTVALRDLSLAIPGGKRVAILGANGCGKSTLFLHVCGILRPAAGVVRVDGQPVRYDRAGLHLLRRRVGLVFQDPDSQLFAASVRQDISFGPMNLDWPEDRVRAAVERAIRDTQIEELADRPTHLLSYGQKKRVAIAGVLAMEPEVIVADEPTAGLDPEMTARLMALLDHLGALGHTVVISTHDVELALAWADEVRVLRKGELIAAGKPEDVFCQRELLSHARLVQPIVLDTFMRLQECRVLPADAPAPRTGAALVELLAQGRAA